MSHLIDKLNYFRKKREPFSNGHGETHDVSREWEDSYRQRWEKRFDELDRVVEELTQKEKSDDRRNRE